MSVPQVQRWYAGGLAVLAGLLLLNTVLGPLGADTLDYPITGSMHAQLIGLEIVTTVLVVPDLLLAAELTRRRRPEGSLLALGGTGYVAYMFVQYVLGPEYTTVPPQVLLQLLITGLASTLVVASWTAAARPAWQRLSPALSRRYARLLGGLAGLVMLRYLPLFAAASHGRSLDPEYTAEPTFYWSIALLDLAVVVPALVAAAVLTQLRHRLAVPALAGALGWFVLVPPSLAAMAAVLIADHDPAGSWPTLVLLLVISVGVASFAARAGRSLSGPMKQAHSNDA